MILLGIACLKAIVSALPLRRCSPGNGIVEGFYDIVGHFLEVGVWEFLWFYVSHLCGNSPGPRPAGPKGGKIQKFISFIYLLLGFSLISL